MCASVLSARAQFYSSFTSKWNKIFCRDHYLLKLHVHPLLAYSVILKIRAFYQLSAILFSALYLVMNLKFSGGNSLSNTKTEDRGTVRTCAGK
jgi:hypothetical protein